MGVTRTQIVKFIRKGDKGDKGNQGAVMRGPQAWSDCATGYAFQAGGANENWLDVVMYNDNYYVCKKSHTKTASNYPGSTTSNNNGYWQLGDAIDLVATKILLTQYALVKNLGVETIDMRDANGNILFQAKNGNVTCKTGTFENVTVKGNLELSRLTYSVNGVDNNWNAIGSMIDFRTLPDYTAHQGPRCYLPNLSGGCREMTFFVPHYTVDDNGGSYPTVTLRGYGEINIPTEYADCFFINSGQTSIQIKKVGIYKFIGITRDIDIEDDGTISYAYDTWYLASATKFSDL